MLKCVFVAIYDWGIQKALPLVHLVISAFTCDGFFGIHERSNDGYRLAI
jgi:hypothetical protein